MKLTKNLVTELYYRCRDIGYGVEEGMLIAYWTGEVDIWGKLTIQPVISSAPTLYLFPDEIIKVEEAQP